MKLLNQFDEITCELVGKSDNYHFLMRCEDCDANVLSRTPLGRVESWYQQGTITQAEFEAYMHVWATFSPHGGRPEWAVTPFDPDVMRIARKLATLIGKELK